MAFEKIVISASRRTDIPAFYMDWFMSRIDKGEFEVVNPYNRRVFTVPATTDKVHTLVFWSKNFGPFLSGNYGEKLLKRGYHLYFSFTVNTENPLLEPNLPPLSERRRQLEGLSGRFGAESVDWRFDPICFYRTETGTVRNNLGDFSAISDIASRNGVRRCITSFMDHYRKIQNRIKPMAGFSFIDPPAEEKIEILLDLNRTAGEKDIRLHLCCEKELLSLLPENAGIKQSACIPNHRLKAIHGGRISLAKDKGQRIQAGCGCRVSVDIGSYNLHPCRHNCLFCYANPAQPGPQQDG